MSLDGKIRQAEPWETMRARWELLAREALEEHYQTIVSVFEADGEDA